MSKTYFSKKALSVLSRRKFERECRWRGKGCYIRVLRFIRDERAERLGKLK